MASYRGALESFAVPADATSRLRALGRTCGATLYMTLLAAFKVLLAGEAGVDDVVVGGTASGRNRAELEGLIGLFVNPLALRTDLSGDPTFVEVLAPGPAVHRRSLRSSGRPVRQGGGASPAAA